MLKPYEEAVLSLPEFWLAGKGDYVIDEIAAMTPAQAAFVVGAMVEHWTLKEGRARDVERLLHAIQRRADEVA
jgi:hypothetical protein